MENMLPVVIPIRVKEKDKDIVITNEIIEVQAGKMLEVQAGKMCRFTILEPNLKHVRRHCVLHLSVTSIQTVN